MIQWFPGHMTSALRMMEENVKLVDMIIYILDARAPLASINPYLDKIIANKPKLYLLNKADMADVFATKKWLTYFEKNGNFAIETNATSNNIKKIILDKIQQILAEKIARNNAKGIKKTLRAMIVGIPNCGKSTIINSVAKAKKATTGDKPGVTRAKQWIRLAENYELLDTPGTLWNSFEDQALAKHLAYVGSISDDVLDLPEIALELLKEFQTKFSKNLEQRYNILIEKDKNSLQIFDEICQSRGFILPGKEIDYLRGAKAILDDFRKGRLGRISLETPQE